MENIMFGGSIHFINWKDGSWKFGVMLSNRGFNGNAPAISWDYYYGDGATNEEGLKNLFTLLYKPTVLVQKLYFPEHSSIDFAYEAKNDIWRLCYFDIGFDQGVWTAAAYSDMDWCYEDKYYYNYEYFERKGWKTNYQITNTQGETAVSALVKLITELNELFFINPKILQR